MAENPRKPTGVMFSVATLSRAPGGMIAVGVQLMDDFGPIGQRKRWSMRLPEDVQPEPQTEAWWDHPNRRNSKVILDAEAGDPAEQMELFAEWVGQNAVGLRWVARQAPYAWYLLNAHMWRFVDRVKLTRIGWPISADCMSTMDQAVRTLDPEFAYKPTLEHHPNLLEHLPDDDAYHQAEKYTQMLSRLRKVGVDWRAQWPLAMLAVFWVLMLLWCAGSPSNTASARSL